MKKSKLSVKDIALIGIMVATLEGGKSALSSLPNVEIVTLLIIMYTLFFGKKVIYAIFIFILMECIIWPIGTWTFMYIYIWPLLALVTYIFRKQDSKVFFSILSGLFGLFFGAMCTPVHYVATGFSVAAAVTWWIAGIPYDVIHCISNFFIMLVLYKPLRKVMSII